MAGRREEYKELRARALLGWVGVRLGKDKHPRGSAALISELVGLNLISWEGQGPQAPCALRRSGDTGRE